MSLNHTIIAGLLPKDGDEVLKALNEASAAGYSLLSTTSCAIDESNAYYIATFGKPLAEPEKRSGISMSGGGPIARKTLSDVNARAPAQQPDTGESS
jgi:hypothetical protein